MRPTQHQPCAAEDRTEVDEQADEHLSVAVRTLLDFIAAEAVRLSVDADVDGRVADVFNRNVAPVPDE